MDFSSPLEALAVLGLDGSATREHIKTAYHRLAAVYHPDSSGGESDTFLRIREAYDYLMRSYDEALAAYLARTRSKGVPSQGSEGQAEGSVEVSGNVTWQAAAQGEKQTGGPRILGDRSAMRQQAVSRHFAQERLRQERRREKQLAAKRQETDARLRAYEEDLAYEEAMRQIHAIRAAEITLKLYEASLRGQLGADSSVSQDLTNKADEL